MIFGNLWDNEHPYSISVDFNPVLGKVRFFLGDKWLLVGELKTIVVDKGLKTASMQIQIPDVGVFLASEDAKDNGAVDWYNWGPRVN